MRSRTSAGRWRPSGERLAARLPPLVAEVIYAAGREAIRNAARHAHRTMPGAPLHLRISVTGEGELAIAVEDDGVGLPLREGAVPPASEGTGQGLALHSTLMAVIGGTLEVDSVAGAHTRVSLRLPVDTWELPGTA